MALSDLSKAEADEAFSDIYHGARTKTEVADAVGVNRSTISRWYNKELMRRGVEETRDKAKENAQTEEQEVYLETRSQELTSHIDVIGDLEYMRSTVNEVLTYAKNADKPYLVLYAVDRLLKVVDTLTSVAAEARKSREESIRSHPEFKKMVSAIAGLLQNHPELEEELREALDESS